METITLTRCNRGSFEAILFGIRFRTVGTHALPQDSLLVTLVGVSKRGSSIFVTDGQVTQRLRRSYDRKPIDFVVE